MNDFIRYEYIYIFQGKLIVMDFQFYVFFAVALVCTFILRSKGSPKSVVVKLLQSASLLLLPLGWEIFLFDRPEFYTFVSSFQHYYNFLNWFSNFDLLVSTTMIFIGSTVVLLKPFQ